MKLPNCSLTLPDGSVLAVLRDDDPDYPGLAITLNDVLAAVVEWHPDYGTPVVRLYGAPELDPDGEPLAYYRWDTGESLPT